MKIACIYIGFDGTSGHVDIHAGNDHPRIQIDLSKELCVEISHRVRAEVEPQIAARQHEMLEAIRATEPKLELPALLSTTVQAEEITDEDVSF